MFLDKKVDPARAFDRCRRHRANTLNDADRHRAFLHCSLLFGGIALYHDKLERAFRWFEYIHAQRRRAGEGPVLSIETGQSDNEAFDAWKARHDLRQLEHLAEQRRGPQVSPYAPQVPDMLLQQLVTAY